MTAQLIISSSSADIIADPQRYLDDIRAGRCLSVADLDYSAVQALATALLHVDDEDFDMANLVPARTGVQNVIFASPKGKARHAARIKIAIDPPDSLTGDGETASMAIHDYSVIGAYMRPALVEQLKAFIDLNRQLLLDYWEGRIETGQLLEGLRPIE
jgi:hypothetical protein